MEGAEEGNPHPCLGRFALCDSSPLIAWVISNLLVEPTYVRTHLHACAYTQHRLSSLSLLNKCFIFQESSSTVYRGQSSLSCQRGRELQRV